MLLLTVPGPTIGLRGALPNTPHGYAAPPVPAAGSTNAAGLNH